MHSLPHYPSPSLFLLFALPSCSPFSRGVRVIRGVHPNTVYAHGEIRSVRVNTVSEQTNKKHLLNILKNLLKIWKSFQKSFEISFKNWKKLLKKNNQFFFLILKFFWKFRIMIFFRNKITPTLVCMHCIYAYTANPPVCMYRVWLYTANHPHSPWK